MNNLAWFYFILSGTSPLLYITVSIDGDDASSMHHLSWSIRLTCRIVNPAPGTSIDRGDPWLSYKPRVSSIGGVFGSYEPIRSGGVQLCCSCVCVVVTIFQFASQIPYLDG